MSLTSSHSANIRRVLSNDCKRRGKEHRKEIACSILNMLSINCIQTHTRCRHNVIYQHYIRYEKTRAHQLYKVAHVVRSASAHRSRILTSSVTCCDLTCKSCSSVLGAPFSAGAGAGILCYEREGESINYYTNIVS